MMERALLFVIGMAAVASSNAAVKCPDGMIQHNANECRFPQAWKQCKAGFYAPWSIDNCKDHTIVVGDKNLPADTKTTRVWWKKTQDSKVCAKTHNIRPKVYCGQPKKNKFTFKEARMQCILAGARLCTSDELKADATAGTGCDYNWMRTWSSTPCGSGKFWTMSGAKKYAKRVKDKCFDEDRKEHRAHVRCCEDQRSDNEEMVCKVCPLGLTSDAGAVHEDGCRCKHGANAEGGCKLPEPAKKSCGSGEFREGSLENCAELKKVGFVDTSRKNHKGEAVCSAARVNGKCSKRVTLKGAVDFCSRWGARLCTYEEVAAGAAAGDAEKCMDDNAPIWTHTKCAANQQAVANRDGTKGYNCVNVGGKKARKFQAYCCADNGNSGGHKAQYCRACPKNNNGASGLQDVYECEPADTYRRQYPVETGKMTPGAGGHDAEFEFVQVNKQCEANQFLVASAATCSELGWTNANKGRSRKTCSSSKVGGRCTRDATYAEAKAKCASVGARLCSSDELMEDEAKGSGCDYDMTRSWSASPCTTKAGGDGFETVAGANRGKNKAPLRCSHEIDDRAAVRCCADTQPKCARCPKHSSSAPGSTKPSDCSCDGNRFGKNGGHCTAPTKRPTARPTNKARPEVTSCKKGFFLEGSAIGCNALGYDLMKKFRNEDGKKACGTARKAGSNECLGKMTWKQNKAHCENRGMRMCSGMEVRNGEGIESNCKNAPGPKVAGKHGQWKTKLFWTKKPCHEDPKWNGQKSTHKNRNIKMHVVSVPYDALNSGLTGTDHDECVMALNKDANKEKEKHYASCCADNGPRYCHTCPIHSCQPQSVDPATGKRSNFAKCYDGATSNEECLCDPDYAYDVISFQVCLGVTVPPTKNPTPNPTKRPTKSPSASPTKPPVTSPSFCPAKQWYQGSGKSCDQLNWGKKTHSINTCGGIQNTVKNKKGNGAKMMCTESEQGMAYYFKNVLGKSDQYLTDSCTGKNQNDDCCSGLMGADEAKTFCESVGARLCHAYELAGNCIHNTGCDYDYTWVWTSQPCVTGGKVGVIAGPGDMDKWDNIRSDCTYYSHCAVGSGMGPLNGKVGPGQPNKQSANGEGDWIHKGNGNLKTFFNTGGVTQGWVVDASDRYQYLRAMADLFKWPKNGAKYVTPDEGSGPRPTSGKLDPRTDQANGQICVPLDQTDGNGDNIKLFVRCCGDTHNRACKHCPAGRTNDPGNDKTFESCVCEGGAPFDKFGQCPGDDQIGTCYGNRKNPTPGYGGCPPPSHAKAKNKKKKGGR